VLCLSTPVWLAESSSLKQPSDGYVSRWLQAHEKLWARTPEWAAPKFLTHRRWVFYYATCWRNLLYSYR
jgi:hypothetical protein